MQQTPVLDQDEYIEQAYFFRLFRERVVEGRPAQDVLNHLSQELLSTTKLPMAVQFLLAELKHHGLLGSAASRLAHYFTPFQAHVLMRSEDEESRFPFEQALLVLEREAEYRADKPCAAGLFVYELECISRNRLGYMDGLWAMARDGFFSSDWQKYILDVRSRLGAMDFAELVLARSQFYVSQRQKSDPDFQTSQSILFSEKEGRIAAANRGKDPMYLFATLQRQLGYPEVPRPTKGLSFREEFNELSRRFKILETKVELLQAELRGQLDITQFYVRKDGEPPAFGNRDG